MEDQLDALSLKFERLSAVKAADISEEASSRHGSYFGQRLTSSQVACIASHVAAWERFLEDGDDFALILEDDVHVSSRVGQLLETLEKFPRSSITRLEATPMWSKATPVATTWKDYKLFKLVGRNTNCAAYIVDRAAAASLSKALRIVSRPIDFAVCNPEVTDVFGVQIYQVVPSPFVQDMYVGGPSRQGFSGSIAASGRKNDDEWRQGPLKRLARAISTAAAFRTRPRKIRAKFA